MVANRSVFVNNISVAETAISLKNYLQTYTGDGTVYALLVKRVKNLHGKRHYAIVQFTSDQHAQRILNLGQRSSLRLSYKVLSTKMANYDIVIKAKELPLKIQKNIHLYVGCKVSEDIFLSFWDVRSVTVNFGPTKLEFFLNYGQDEYRLELDISTVISCMQKSDESHYYLQLQLKYAPFISKRNIQVSSQTVHEYYTNQSDKIWIRTTDFTPLSCIGQATGMCLKVNLPCYLEEIITSQNLLDTNSHNFTLDEGIAFCIPSDIVPLIGTTTIEEFAVLFQVNSLLHKGILAGPTLNSDFYDLIINTPELSMEKVKYGLSMLSKLKHTCYDPSTFLSDHYSTYDASKSASIRIESCLLGNGLASVFKILITPSKVYFNGPLVITSNKVLRQYRDITDSFLLVSFVDENKRKIRASDLYYWKEKEKTLIYKRILSILKNGIEIGNKKFEFLAYSSSQLRVQSLWMFATTNGLSPDNVRSWLGDFNRIKTVAKYAARLGQSFGASIETSKVEDGDFEIIDDITLEVSENREYTFSDGIGKISSAFAEKIAREYGIKDRVPSAFQIRFAGYKGVVAVDPQSNIKLSLRSSMRKYPSHNKTIDVLSFSKYHGCYLDRQIITLLSSLKVPDYVFENKMQIIVKNLNEIFDDPNKAKHALMSMGTRGILNDMLKIGYKPLEEPYLYMMLGVFKSFKSIELRKKARLFVPLGRCLLGVLDESNILEYGQIFARLSKVESDTQSEQDPFVVTGRSIVCKSPCLHPGDIRILDAVDVPELYHLVDCVVFPQKGNRPHPDECSGSDLDGDIYFVCWDPELIPPTTVPPMEYVASPLLNDGSLVPQDVSMEDIKEYFVHYLLSNKVGIISDSHQVFADKETDKACSKACLHLANLFSVAVDSAKTGIAVEIPSDLFVTEYPDFMERRDKPSYVSNGILGKLFRAVKVIKEGDENQQPDSFYDRDMEYDGFNKFTHAAHEQKEKYDAKLRSLMRRFKIESEAEMVGYSIFDFRLNKEDSDAILDALKVLNKEVRTWFTEGGHTLAKSSAAYYVTYHPQWKELTKPPHFISFPWLMHVQLLKIKGKKLYPEQS